MDTCHVLLIQTDGFVTRANLLASLTIQVPTRLFVCHLRLAAANRLSLRSFSKGRLSEGNPRSPETHYIMPRSVSALREEPRTRNKNRMMDV